MGRERIGECGGEDRSRSKGKRGKIAWWSENNKSGKKEKKERTGMKEVENGE